jgi:hypothetical protein
MAQGAKIADAFIEVGVDATGVTGGLKEIKQGVQDAGSTIEKEMGQKASAAVSLFGQKIEQMTSKSKLSLKEIASLKVELNALRATAGDAAANVSRLAEAESRLGNATQRIAAQRVQLAQVKEDVAGTVKGQTTMNDLFDAGAGKAGQYAQAAGTIAAALAGGYTIGMQLNKLMGTDMKETADRMSAFWGGVGDKLRWASDAIVQNRSLLGEYIGTTKAAITAEKELAELMIAGMRRKANAFTSAGITTGPATPVTDDLLEGRIQQQKAIEAENAKSLAKRQQQEKDNLAKLVVIWTQEIADWEKKTKEKAKIEDDLAKGIAAARVYDYEQVNAQRAIGLADLQKSIDDEMSIREEASRKTLSIQAYLGERQKTIFDTELFEEQERFRQLLLDTANNSEARLAIEKEHEERLKLIQERSRASQLQAAAAMLGGLANLFGSLASAQDETSKKGFERSKKMRIAEAVMASISGAIQAYQSAAAIPLVGWILAPIAAAAALIAGYANVAKIKKQTYQGQAHGGLDSVPTTGTFLLQGGEAVVPREPAAKMRRLADSLEGGAAGGKELQVVFSFAGSDESMIAAIMRKMNYQVRDRGGELLASGVVGTARAI